MGKVKFRHISDIEAFENTPIEERMKAFNTYDLIKNGASINPDATAISFFLAGDTYDQPMQVTYRDLMANITRTANLFHDLGVGPHDVISYLLPNLPHTHYVLWGGRPPGLSTRSTPCWSLPPLLKYARPPEPKCWWHWLNFRDRTSGKR